METYLDTEGESSGKRREIVKDIGSSPRTTVESTGAQALVGGAAGAATSPSPAPHKIIGAGIRADLGAEDSKTGRSKTILLQPKKEEENFEIPKVGDYLLKIPYCC